MRLPAHSGNGWALMIGRRVKPCADLPEVRSALKRWAPLSPTLVGAPGSSTFQTVPDEPRIGSWATEGFRRRNLLGIAALSLMAALMWMSVSPSSSSKSLPVALLVTMITLLSAVDHFLGMRTDSQLSERSRFFYWVQTAPAVIRGFRLWIAIVLLMGGVQTFLQDRMGLDELVQSYGLMFDAVRAGQWWRVLVGPFFHSGPAHFINNAALALFIGPLVWARFPATGLLVFVIGNTLGALAQMTWGSADFDSYLGISGGLFAMAGLLIASGMVERDLLPASMVPLIVGLVLLSAFGSTLSNSRTANLSHLVGIAFGTASGMLLVRLQDRHSIS